MSENKLESAEEQTEMPDNLCKTGSATARSCSSASTVSSFQTPCGCGEMDALQVKAMLAEIINDKYDKMKKAFQNYDRRKSGKVLRSQLRQVFRTFCMPLTTNQFNCLVPETKADKCGKVIYEDILGEITGIKRGPCEEDPMKEQLPRSVTLDELEQVLKIKIDHNLKSVIKGCFLYDVNKDGFIQKREFRKVLENNCFKMSTEQFNFIWHRYDPKNTGLICYEDFLLHLGINVSRQKHYLPEEAIAKISCWSQKEIRNFIDTKKMQDLVKTATETFNDDPESKGLGLVDIIKLFLSKIRCKEMGDLITKGCLMFDPKNTGYVTKDELHSTLNNFVMPLSKGLFLQIMQTCLPTGCCPKKICWKSFVERYCYNKHASVLNKCIAKIDPNGQAMSIIEKIKMNVLNPKDRLDRALTYYTDGHRAMTRPEFRNCFEKENFSLSEEEYRILFTTLDPTHSNILLVKDIFSMFEYPEVSPCDPSPPGLVKNKINKCVLPNYRDPNRCKPEKNNVKCVSSEETLKGAFPELSDVPLQRKLAISFCKNYNMIMSALRAADYKNTSRIHVSVLRKIIESFCFPLEDKQWFEILSDFETYRDEIYYKMFVESYKKGPEKELEQWMKNVGKLMTQKKKHGATILNEEVVECVKEIVRVKKNTLLNDFTQIDFCDTGCIHEEDFRRVVNKHIFRMNDCQFYILWEQVPKNDIGRLVYRKFIDVYGGTDASETCPDPIDCYDSAHSYHEPKLPSPRPFVCAPIPDQNPIMDLKKCKEVLDPYPKSKVKYYSGSCYKPEITKLMGDENLKNEIRTRKIF